MNEERDPHTRLIAEAFHDDWASGQASAFARAAAAHARRRRALRRSLLVSGAVAVVLAALLAVSRERTPESVEFAAKPFRTITSPPALLSVVSPAFEIISDEELMQQLRDRPVLILPQPNGTREFVLLAHK